MNEARLIDCQQYSRNANLEIKGIPVKDRENLMEIMAKLWDSIGERISSSDIDACHRVPVPNNTAVKNIVVQFTQRRKRDAILENPRKKKVICDDIGLGSTDLIYVNEHLCPDKKRLLGKATSKKREVNWKLVWVRGG